MLPSVPPIARNRNALAVNRGSNASHLPEVIECTAVAPLARTPYERAGGRKYWDDAGNGSTLSATSIGLVKENVPARVRFGDFALDLKTGELCPHAAEGDDDRRILLQEQPFRVLLMLVERNREIVTREEIKKKLWPNDTIVEFDHSINVIIGSLRRALGDSAEKPQYIETLARRGYRLMVPVEWERAADDEPPNGDAAPVATQIAAAGLIGKKVSHYRVLEVIGGGGMGLVYKAEDLKLGRRVALKFLPDELASDPIALQRFEREAQTASSLNHPNICTIYEVEEYESQPFIVMELLEGETLRDRLAAVAASQKLLSVDELLNIAIPVAEGLEAAHQKGIIHRDIKPANIFLTAQGQVKILDFGLAKLSSPATGNDAEETQHSSVPAGPQPKKKDETLTRTGSAMGTAGYMSPEQVRGEKLDARTDLFSFGLVLYEMATGQRAFTGETAAIVHDAIVNVEPVAVSEINSALPPKLVAIIDTALRKDRALRYQTAAEMSTDLRSMLQHGSTRWRGSRWILVGAVAAALCVGGFFVRRPKPWPQQPAKEPILHQLTPSSLDGPVLDSIALSPDGKHLAYLDSAKGVSLLQTDSGENRSLPGTAPGTASFFPNSWLPDGDHLFMSKPGASGTWTMSISDGTVRKFRDEGPLVPSPNGQQLAFKNDKDEIWIMSATGESPKRVVTVASPWTLETFSWSPTGKRIAYDKTRIRAADRSKSGAVIDASLDSCDLDGQCSAILSDSKLQNRSLGESSALVWLPDGRIVFALMELPPNDLDSNLWSLAVDANTGLLQGKPKRLTSWTGFSQEAFTASADGKRLIFQQVHIEGILKIAEIRTGGSGLGPARPLKAETWFSGVAAWTHDSRKVLFSASAYGKRGIFKQDVNASSPQPLVSGSSSYDTPVVSPEGKWLLYTEHREDGTARLMRMPIEGGAAAFVLSGDHSYRCASAPANLCILSEVSGKQAVFYELDPLKGRGRELARADIKKNFHAWDLSPNGKNIALVAPAEEQVRIINTDSGDVRSVPLKGWNMLQFVSWTADGRRLYLSGARDFTAAAYYEFAIFEADLAGNIKMLVQMSGAKGWIHRPVASPDGRYLIYNERTWPSSVMMLENF